MVSCFLRLGMGRLVRNPLVGREVNRRVLAQILGENYPFDADGLYWPKDQGLSKEDYDGAITRLTLQLKAALWGVIVNHHLAAMMRNQPISAFST
jgi:hypothetical protein